MFRYLIAFASMFFLTFAPAAYKFTLLRRNNVDFIALSHRLDNISLEPNGWKSSNAPFEFDNEWKARLGLRHHRSIQLVSPTGRRQVVLLMLSETGEQLFHTPDVCYQAHGCDVSGEVLSFPIPKSGEGNIRAVKVKFSAIGDVASGIAAYGYWVDSKWYSPPQQNILNLMGRQPYLLKIQIILENQATDDPATLESLEEYLLFLAEQFRKQNL